MSEIISSSSDGRLDGARSTIAESIIRHLHAEPGAPILWHAGEWIVRKTFLDHFDAGVRLVESTRLPGGSLIFVDGEKTPANLGFILAAWMLGYPVFIASPNWSSDYVDRVIQATGAIPVDRPAHADADAHSPPPDRVTAGASGLQLATSGTTGAPKIVNLTAAAIAHFADWARSYLKLGPFTRSLSFAPLNFDLSLLELWGVLAAGGAVVLPDAHQLSRDGYLRALVREQHVDLLQGVGHLYQLLLGQDREPDPPFDKVGTAIFTGEKFSPAQVARIATHFPNARLLNVYGCTETNDSFVEVVDIPRLSASGRDYIPLGAAIAGTTFEIDTSGSSSDTPHQGELLVNTPFQSIGYSDARLTDERFVLRADGKVYFRSGDLVVRHPDGTLELLGRIDHQIKIHGVRINTQEVESILADHPAVDAAVVLVKAPQTDEARLVAVVNLKNRWTCSSLELRKHCATRLPRTSIPREIWIARHELPRGSNGKFDRKSILANLGN
ncbi:AMP-binding protein [Burkholderia stagnalis]|uniref:Amino acid adenylation domain-containing protein n=1 Tax=Burkholderia stagnalis TaxID=1503054 RepID=A0A6L3MMW6_9BURK|nr:AMP-binding protein [Burkholderia stagnalis]KAB0633123.1 amino acid adenylation domain-containing protein [Burkholderia stagnalis]VWB55266.1 amino acid adenylation protein [Burkholderia stagnalis]